MGDEEGQERVGRMERKEGDGDNRKGCCKREGDKIKREGVHIVRGRTEVTRDE